MAEFPALPLFTDAYLGDTVHLTTIEHGAYLLLLMCMWRSNGTLPNNDKLLARYSKLSPSQWKRIKPILWPLFDVSNEGITQGRLSDELDYVKANSKKQSDRAKTRWNKQKGKSESIPVKQDGMQLLNDDDPNLLNFNDMEHTNASERQCHGNAPHPTHTPPTTYEGSISVTTESCPKSEPTPPKGGDINLFQKEFVEIWKAYPRKVKKEAALKAYIKARKQFDYNYICKPLRRFINATIAEGDPKSMVHLSTYLNEKRFDPDEDQEAAVTGRTPQRKTNGKSHNNRQQFDEAHREYARRIGSGEIDTGPDESDPFAGM